MKGQRILISVLALGLGLLFAYAAAASAPALQQVSADVTQCSDLITNGSFETGEFAGWQTSGHPWLGEQAHAGVLSGALGGSNDASDQFYQEVTLPAAVDSATLAFWWYMETSESGIGTPADFLYVEVRNTSGGLLNTLETQSNASTAGAWQYSSIDLTAYPDLLGLTVRVVFRGVTNGSNPTTFYIDEVSLQTCTTVACPYDWKEPNDNFDAAAAIEVGISYYTIYICPSGDEDWFWFHADEGDALDVQLYNLPVDYDLELYDPSAARVAYSAGGGTADERIQWEATASGNYRVRVYGYNGAWSTDGYTLRVDLTAPATPTPTPTRTPTATRTHTPTPTVTPTETPSCPYDRFEPNGSFEEAAAIETGVAHTAYICPQDDQDWFKFYVNAGQQITADLDGLHGNLPADFDLYLYNPSGTQVTGSAASGAAPEQILYTAEQTGEYRVQVLGYAGAYSSGDPYRLSLQMSAPPCNDVIVLEELFASGALPSDWSNVDNVGNGQAWRFDDPGGRGNLTGGSGDFAIVDSDHYGSGNRQDAELWTPSLDLSEALRVTLAFDTHFRVAAAEFADVDVSTDGGETWSNVWRRSGADYGPTRATVDLSSRTVGQSDVIARFHYFNASYAWWWQVDNVQMIACRPSVYGVAVTPSSDARSGDPGTTVTYGLQVINTGNTADTFDVSVSGNAWTTSAPATAGPLAAGASTSINVTVDIPPGAAGGESDTATVTVTSQGNNNKSDSSFLTTTARSRPAASIEIGVLPETQTILSGATLTFTVIVTNTGDVNLNTVVANNWHSEGINNIPDCAEVLGKLAAGASKSYTCAVSGVTTDYTAHAEVTGNTPINSIVTDSDTSTIIVVPPARIGDRVWSDTDADGIQDVGESGVPAVTVSMYDGTGAFVDSTITDSNGDYTFTNLLPGDCFVVFDPPADYVFSPKDRGGDDGKDSDADPETGRTATTTLSAGENDVSWDAGLYKLTAIGDLVWLDDDADGVQDLDERGLAGVAVKLYSGAGTFISSTTTITDGFYSFTSLKPGDYYVQFVPPTGYLFSPPDAVITDTIDSDAITTTGKTAIITLAGGVPQPHWDAGLYQLAVQFQDDSLTVNEGAGTATLTVTLSGPSSVAVTVNYATLDGSATADSDYTSTSGTLTFTPGQTNKTIAVPIVDDSIYEETDETLLVALSNPTNAGLGATANATVLIVDNDPWPGQRFVDPCGMAAPTPSPTPTRPGPTPSSHVYLPIILKGFSSSAPTPTVTPTPTSTWQGTCDGRQLMWAQEDPIGSRRVLLRWRLGSIDSQAITTTAFNVYRRQSAASSWTLIAQTDFADGPGEMEDILGAALIEQLNTDLQDYNPEYPTRNLTIDEIYRILQENQIRASMLADNYYQVGLAIGQAYLDTSAPPGIELEYRVLPSDATWPVFGPVTISPLAEIPPPQNLRESEMFDGPAQLGVPGSTRPYTATERYDWDLYQPERRVHGRVSLVWDSPGAGQSNLPSYYISGYNVYRKGSATGADWQKANPYRTPGDPSSGYRLIRPGNPNDLEDLEAEVFFEDDLKTIFAGREPLSVYTNWSYAVCPVDLLGNEASCAELNNVPVRELDGPTPANDISITTASDHSVLTVTVTYSDVTEISTPLRFFVSRAITTGVPITDWLDLRPQGIPAPSSHPTFTVSITDNPPKETVYWYRVQVRDNAGNWSAPSAPVKGALYPRTPPPFGPIAYDPNNCAQNPLPLNLTSLDSRVRQIIVYRSFTPSDPASFQLIQRIKVNTAARTATFAEAYEPPYRALAYYKLEALDGYGNVSNQQSYCAPLNPGNSPDSPSADILSATWNPETRLFDVVLGIDGPKGGLSHRKTTLTRVSNDPQTPTQTTSTIPPGTTQTTTSTEEGETARIGISNINVNGDSPPVTKWVREVNDFLETNRHLTDLGQPVAVQWGTGATPSVGVYLRGINYDDAGIGPYVALFRRTMDSNWLQVTPPLDLYQQTYVRYPTGSGWIETWMITDTADLDLHQAYEYMALAFSPLSFEALGYWRPISLAAYSGGPDYIRLTSTMSPPPKYPTDPGCDSYQLRDPGDYSWWQSPGHRIKLHNGWFIIVDKFRDYDGNCGGLDLASNQLFGTGRLFAGGELNWTVDFINIAANATTGEHQQGRIVATLNHTASASGRLNADWQYVEFLPGQASAQVILNLSPNVKVVDHALVERSHRLLGVFAGARPNFRFDPLAIDTTGRLLWLIDENLPWQIMADQFEFAYDAVRPSGSVHTLDRLDYAPVTALTAEGLPLPDNNLAFLRERYTSSDTRVTKDGLQGTFTSNPSGGLDYRTSLPAGAVIAATGATVEISQSQISGGALHGATILLNYYAQGTDISFMSQISQLLRTGYRDPLSDPRTLLIQPTGGDLTLYPGGLITASISMQLTALTWNGSYTATTGLPGVHVSFYAAAASFPENGQAIGWTRLRGDAPAPAENAWRKLPAPIQNSYLDPGVNVNAVNTQAGCDCFRPSTFNDVDLDLYVRRGGVSGNFRINAQSYGEIREKNGYLVTIQKYNLLFVDNAVVPPTEAELDLRLPYPSDVSLPLQATDFTASGCPSGGKLRSLATLEHKYWRFTHSPTAWRFDSNARQKYVDQCNQDGGRCTEIPAGILSLQGQATINGLGEKTTNLADTGKSVAFPALSEWLPTGDYGDVRPYPEGSSPELLPDYFRVSGVPYALRDVKLSRYYSKIMDTASKPATLGVELGATMLELPKELLDANGQLTPDSLKNCAEPQGSGGPTVAGCGFVLVDGNGTVKYFGEIKKDHSSVARQKQIAGQTSADAPKGQFPVVTNNRQKDKPAQATTEQPNLSWAYPIVDKYIDLPIPVKFLANSSGGALVGVKPDIALLPGAEVFKTDVSVAATVRFENGFEMDVGIFLGYTASQAAFRALAMNRPEDDGKPGVKPFTNWSDVEDDVTKWAKKFGYQIKSGDKDDPTDLAKKLWSSWGTKSYTDTFNILKPTVQGLKGKEAYGITGIQSGSVLNEAGTTLSTGMGQVVLVIAGGDVRLDSVQFGAMIDVQTGKKGGSNSKSNDKLLHVDWLGLEINRDGEILIEAKNASTSLTGDYDIHADIILLIGTKEGFERIEGGITIAKLDLSQVKFKNLGAVFGAGRYNYQALFYLGLKGEGDFSGYKVGGALLFGWIDPQSKVLRAAGFAHLLDKIGLDKSKSKSPAPSGTFAGVYVAVYGDFPIYGKSCIAEVKASAELRGWYFTPTTGGTPIYGGYLRGSVYGTALCLVSARGELTLIIEQLRQGGTSDSGRTCTAKSCTAFSGEFWAAIGIGFCEPDTWTPWKQRWWNDDWCYNMGLQAQVTYIDPKDDKGDWDASFKIEAE